jgi:hypothetical protein
LRPERSSTPVWRAVAGRGSEAVSGPLRGLGDADVAAVSGHRAMLATKDGARVKVWYTFDVTIERR